MCGIFGILTPDPSEINLQEITDRLYHRGPDDSGVYVGAGVALSARRLSIIDLPAGHQPLSNEDNLLWLVCNGEIVNAPELRSTLEGAGHIFKTHTDTETILHGYEQWGEKVISRLRGMFAFALWDCKARKILLARDRFGIKPLYYARSGERFAFASEILPILGALPGLPRRANTEALWRLLEVGFVPTPLSAFQGIMKLPAAHLLIIQDGLTHLTPYWKPEYPPLGEHSSLGLPQAAQAFIEQTRSALTAWRLSDVPVGSLLSGGIDSATLATMLTEISGRPIHTFNLGFDAPALDESDLARQISDSIGSQHHQTTFSQQSFETFPQVIARLEEPQSGAISLSLNLIYQSCQEAGFKVVMTGEGADELLGGYSWYQGDQRLRPLLRLSPAIRSRIAQLRLVKSPDIRRLLQFGDQNVIRRYCLWQQAASPDQIARLLNAPAPTPISQIWEDQYAPDLRGLHPVDQMLFIESRTRLVDYINLLMDRMSMSHSVEARPPFLDHLLWEFTACLPPEMKLTRQGNKYLLRLGMQNRLPEAVIHRRKKGLSSPITAWWRRLPEWAEDLMQPSDLVKTGYFNPTEVARLRGLHATGQVNMNRALTLILTTQIWHSLFLDER